MKRIRLNQDNILLNAAALVDQITTQAPSAELLDTHKAIFAHTLGAQAILVSYGYFKGTPQELIRIIQSNAGLSDTYRTLEGISEKISEGLTTEERNANELLGQLRDIQIPSFKHQDVYFNLYSYILFRHSSRAFQHFNRRIKLVIPAKFQEAIGSWK